MPGAGLVVVDRESGAVVFRKVLAEVDDEHSLVFENGSLLVVSTGTDSVLEYTVVEIDGNIVDVVYKSNVWSSLGSEKIKDTEHINSISKTSKGIYVSGFGKKETERWKTARDGYVWNITTNEKVTVKPILHPHSVLEYAGDLYFCESATCTVKKNEEKLIFLGNGYVRGLAVSDKYIVVGVSEGRKVSKSLGVENKVEEVQTADCSVHVYSKDNLEFIRKIDFAGQRNEIYDILSTWTN
jgi:hypothetical protein